MYRYKIVEIYHGGVNFTNDIAFVDSLRCAILLVNALRKLFYDDLYYEFDFIKIDNKIDNKLDCVYGRVINASNFADVPGGLDCKF